MPQAETYQEKQMNQKQARVNGDQLFPHDLRVENVAGLALVSSKAHTVIHCPCAMYAGAYARSTVSRHDGRHAIKQTG